MPARYATLIDALDAAPPDLLFATVWHDDEDVQSVTFGEYRRACDAQRLAFQAHGLGPGDRVILILPQGVSLLVALGGAILAGAVPSVLAYPSFRFDQAKYRAGLRGVSRNLGAGVIVVDEAFPPELLDGLVEELGLPVVRPSSLSDAVASPPGPRPTVTPRSLAAIQHSAGTTGLQKGVALTHAAILTQVEHLAEALALTRDDRIYSWLPLYHDMGFIACFMLPLVCHLPIVMQSPTQWVMRPSSMLSLIGQYACTVAWVPNFALQFIARRCRDDEHFDLSTLRLLINCSEPVRADSLDAFASLGRRHGMRASALQSSYAMAENVFAVTQSDIGRAEGPVRLRVDARTLRERGRAVPACGEDPAVTLVSSGRCLSGNRVRIVSADRQDLPDGDVGEILIQSDSLFDGYFNRPDLSALAFAGPWYRTRDRGFLHDGELYVLGRSDDMIIVAGRNIAPHDVEAIACTHPRLRDGRAVAFGEFDAGLGTDALILVVETVEERDCADAVTIELSVRAAVSADLGVAVAAVHVRPPNWIVKSTAGKPARAATRDKLLREATDR